MGPSDTTKCRRSLNDVLGKRSSPATGAAAPSHGKRARPARHGATVTGWRDLGQGCRIGYWPRLVPQEQHDECFQALLKEAPWRRCEVMMFGKPVMQPREICYMAESTDLGYRYSGSDMIVEPFHETVLNLKKLAEDTSGDKFNSCLLNLYHHGQEYMGWHSGDLFLNGAIAELFSQIHGPNPNPNPHYMLERK